MTGPPAPRKPWIPTYMERGHHPRKPSMGTCLLAIAAVASPFAALILALYLTG